MPAPSLRYWLPSALAAVIAAALAAAALLPASLLAPPFELVDHDDSVHPLPAARLAGIRAALGAGAVLYGAVAALLAARRRRVAQGVARLQAQASAILQTLSLPATLPFGLILLAALAVRVAILDGPMRFDEADTFDYFATRSFFNALTDYTAPNNHILHTLFVRLSHLALGDTPPAIRLPALVAGMLALPLTFLFAKRLFGETAAYFAMALAAIHPGLVSYSAEARGYTLLCVFTLLAFLAASFLREQRNRFAWIVFAVSGTLGMFTVPVMLYPLSTASVWALWTANPERRGRLAFEIAAAAAVIAAASALLYAPAAMRSGVDSIVANRFVRPITWPVALERLPQSFSSVWSIWTDHLSVPVLLFLAVTVLAGLRRRESRRLAAVVVGTACLLMLAQRVVPYGRVFLYAAPLLCVIAGEGLRRLWPKPALAPALAGLLAVHYFVGYRWFPTPAEQLFREVDALAPLLLRETAEDKAVLGAAPLSEPLRYRFFTNGRPRAQVLGPEAVPLQFAGWKEIFVVRPKVRDPRPGYWYDFDGPEFEAFVDPQPFVQGDRVEVLRLVRVRDPQSLY